MCICFSAIAMGAILFPWKSRKTTTITPFDISTWKRTDVPNKCCLNCTCAMEEIAKVADVINKLTTRLQ